MRGSSVGSRLLLARGDRGGFPQASDVAILIVENGGERLDPTVVATLAERFQRGTARIRRSDHERNGLGLAIVGAIVGAHGGELTLAAQTTGGLRATVRVPVDIDPAS